MTVLVRWGEVVEKDRIADVVVDAVDDIEDVRTEEVGVESREARAMRGRADDEGNNVGGMMLVVVSFTSYKYRKMKELEKAL